MYWDKESRKNRKLIKKIKKTKLHSYTVRAMLKRAREILQTDEIFMIWCQETIDNCHNK